MAIPKKRVDDMGMREGYHGTSHDLIGDEIHPAIGQDRKTHGLSSSDAVNYQWDNTHKDAAPTRSGSSPGELHAWGWATDSADRKGGRARVHKGTAQGAVSYDRNLPSHYADQTRALEAESLKVKETIFTPPPSRSAKEKGEGVQGTFPHINWNQFGVANVGSNAISTAISSADQLIHGSGPVPEAPAPSAPQKQVTGQQAMFDEPKGDSAEVYGSKLRSPGWETTGEIRLDKRV